MLHDKGATANTTASTVTETFVRGLMQLLGAMSSTRFFSDELLTTRSRPGSTNEEARLAAGGRLLAPKPLHQQRAAAAGHL